MTDAGAFNDKARAAIYLATLDRCAGCGRAGDLSAQHRRARGMGGTSDVSIGHPANGVALCGGQLAGVRGCHGWAERNPVLAELLGWRLAPGDEALGSPFYGHPWRAWLAWDEDVLELRTGGSMHVTELRTPIVRFVDVEEDLDRVDERMVALERMREARPLPVDASKSQR